MAKHQRKARRTRQVLNEKAGFPHVEKLTKDQLERLAEEQANERDDYEGRHRKPDTGSLELKGAAA